MASRRRSIPRPRAGTPTIAEVIRQAITSRLLDVHTAIPGKVVKYYAATGSQAATVDVQPMIRQATPASDGSTVLEDLPIVMNVPIGWMQTASASLQLKLAADDTGLLVFSEAAMAQWRVTGASSEPGDLRRHDLSYPTFMPCLAPDAKALPSMAGGEGVVLDANAVIRMGGPGAALLAIAEKVMTNFTDLKSAINGWTPVPNDGGAALKTALSSLFSTWPEAVATTKVKGE